MALLLVTTVLTFLLVVLGGIVCVTDASGGCPDWPTCHGRFLPPLRFDSILEYTHRLLAGLTALAILASALAGWRRAPTNRWVSRPPQVAFLFLIVVSVLGALTVLRGLSPAAAAADLGSALIVLALLLVATVTALSQRRNPASGRRLSLSGALGRLALLTLVAVLAVLVSGVFTASSNRLLRCLGWPSYGALQLPLGASGWHLLARWVGACLAGLLVLLVVALAWRLHRRRRPIRRAAAGVGALFLAQSAVGLILQATGFQPPLLAIQVALTAAFWSAVVVFVTLAALEHAGQPT
jgi:heme A synthase